MIQLFLYELRSQRKRFIIISIMVAIALSCFIVIDAFIWYADTRVAAEAKPLAWADIVLDSTRVWTDESTSTVISILQDKWVISQRVQLNTNITSPTDSRLVQLLAIDSAYPLYWNIDVQSLSWRTFVFGAWVAVDRKTYEMLPGGVITIWEMQLPVDWIIQDNPSLSLNLFTQGRQVFMPLSRIDETWLITTGSRAEYEYLIKVYDPDTFNALLEAFRKSPTLSPQRDVDNYQWRVSQVWELLDELWLYLLLIIFCGFLLVAVTNMLSIDEYLYRRFKIIAIMQILWLRKKHLIGMYGLLFVGMVVVSSILAVGISLGVMLRIQRYPVFSGFSITASTIWQWIWISIILAIVAWVLPLLKLLLRTPLEWLWESLINLSTPKEKIYSLVIILLSVVFVLRIIGESRLQTATLWGFLLWGYAIVRLLIRGLFMIWSRVNTKVHTSFIAFDAIRSTTRPGNTSMLIASTLVVALSVSLLIMQFGWSFIKRLQFTNANQPNWYLINVSKDGLASLRDQWIQDPAYNIVLWRIVSINDVPLSDFLWNKKEIGYQNSWDDASSRFTREFNITTVELPKTDTIAGEHMVPMWWVSLDKEFARDLWVWLWDAMKFAIAGKEFQVKVTWLRNTDRTNFTPFFYVQLHDKEFEKAPMTYFLTLTIPVEKQDEMRKTLSSVLRPGVALIEIDAIIASIRTISSRIIDIVAILLWVILLFACFTTIVCVENMRYAKEYKMRLYGILGATNKQSRYSVVLEYWYVLAVSIITSIVIWRGTAAYFISTSSFLTWSWWSSMQWLLLIIAIIALNIVVIWRTMKK